MEKDISKHAKVRFRQRGIRNDLVNYLLKYGKEMHAPGGAVKIHLTRRDANRIIGNLKKEIHWLERANGIILIEKEGNILTGYHRN